MVLVKFNLLRPQYTTPVIFAFGPLLAWRVFDGHSGVKLEKKLFQDSRATLSVIDVGECCRWWAKFAQ